MKKLVPILAVLASALPGLFLANTVYDASGGEYHRVLFASATSFLEGLVPASNRSPAAEVPVSSEPKTTAAFTGGNSGDAGSTEFQEEGKETKPGKTVETGEAVNSEAAGVEKEPTPAAHPEEIAESAESVPQEKKAQLPPKDPPQPVLSGFVFLNDLAAGWKTDASSASVDTMSNIAYCGPRGIRAKFSTPADELRFSNDGFVNAREYDGINFYIRGKKGDERVTISLYDASGAKLGSQDISRYLSAKKMTTDYAQMYMNFIPLHAPRAEISGISFTLSGPGEIYVDDITFTREPSPRPTNGLGDTYAAEVFMNALENGWELVNVNADTRIYHADGIDGSPSLQTTFRLAGQSLNFRHEQGMHTYLYDELTFQVHGQALKNTIDVAVRDDVGTSFKTVRLQDYLKKYNYDEFQRVTIPLDDFGAKNVTLNEILFTTRVESEGLYLDDIKFE